MSAPLIEIVGLSKAFPLRGGLFGGIRGEVKAVSDVSFTLAKGDVFGLAGESGSGKSTIARMIMGLTDPSAGAILLDGLDLTGLHMRAGSQQGRPDGVSESRFLSQSAPIDRPVDRGSA